MARDFCFFLASHSSSFQPCIACSLKLHFNFMFFQLKLKSIKLKWPQQRSLCYLAVFEGFRQTNSDCIYFTELKWRAHSVCCLFMLLAIRRITICLLFCMDRYLRRILSHVPLHCGQTIHYHHHKASRQPASSATGRTHAQTHSEAVSPHTHTHNRYNCTFISLPFTLFTTRRKEQVASLEMASKSTGLL